MENWGLSEWLHWQETLNPKDIDLDLQRIQIVASRLEILPPENLTFLIGGTNGKGETSRCVYEFLSKNESVGLWTSPHLESVSERFTFSKNFQVDDLELTQTFQFLKEWLEDQQTQLSYFEFLFICFMLLASRKNVDFLILEVGLGGRLDATNVIPKSLISTVSYTHLTLPTNREV